MAETYTPALADALSDAFAGQAFDDPLAYTTKVNKRVDVKYFGKPVQDELLALIAACVARPSLRTAYTCLAGLTVGSPVYVSAADTVTLADATTQAKSRVIGFCRYKPTTTTCYLEQFQRVTGLTGLTAGSPVYLSDAGAVAATDRKSVV